MAKKNDQKIKLLKLYELLKLETDEGDPLTTREICEQLGDIGITCDRRTLSKDIALLNEYDYEIMSVMIGHDKAYYIEDRRFSIPELKILIDAVQAANFITEKKTNELTTKVAALSSSNKAEVLKGNTVIFNTRKHSNESIYYNIGYINEAIENKRKVSFNYYDLDEEACKVYRRDKDRYVTDPMALVYNHDNYYLMTYSSKYDDIVNYRVDRMDSVEVEEKAVCSKAIIQTDNISSYTEQVFKMFGGPTKDIVLQFDSSLMGIIYDKFGEDVKMMRHNEDTCITTVKIQVSPVFFGWLFQFGNKMKILSPESLVREYRRLVEEVCGELE